MFVSHFARSFKASLGVPAHRWLVLRRIERAKELMLATQSGLSDIALEAGFSDQASFNRTFRQFVGISPGRWRRELGRTVSQPLALRSAEPRPAMSLEPLCKSTQTAAPIFERICKDGAHPSG
jgi:AraC-like DNA-binding protein